MHRIISLHIFLGMLDTVAGQAQDRGGATIITGMVVNMAGIVCYSGRGEDGGYSLLYWKGRGWWV